MTHADAVAILKVLVDLREGLWFALLFMIIGWLTRK